MNRESIRWAALVLAAGCALALGACNSGGGDMPDKDIMAVVDEHAPRLIQIEGVSGVAVGRLPRGRPCVRIYVVELTDELRAQLPDELEGYPVDIEVSGEFRPLEDGES
jgi:hypothetical protein